MFVIMYLYRHSLSVCLFCLMLIAFAHFVHKSPRCKQAKTKRLAALSLCVYLCVCCVCVCSMCVYVCVLFLFSAAHSLSLFHSSTLPHRLVSYPSLCILRFSFPLSHYSQLHSKSKHPLSFVCVCIHCIVFVCTLFLSILPHLHLSSFLLSVFSFVCFLC